MPRGPGLESRIQDLREVSESEVWKDLISVMERKKERKKERASIMAKMPGRKEELGESSVSGLNARCLASCPGIMAPSCEPGKPGSCMLVEETNEQELCEVSTKNLLRGTPSYTHGNIHSHPVKESDMPCVCVPRRPCKCKTMMETCYMQTVAKFYLTSYPTF